MKVGAVIKQAREERRLRQSDLAKTAKINLTYLSHVENDKKTPTLTVYFKICKALGMSPTEMMRRIEETAERGR